MKNQLFFSLNLKKSLYSKLLFIDIYFCKIKLKKNNQYTGILKKYDKKNFKELNSKEKEILKDLNLLNFNTFFIIELDKINKINLDTIKEKIPFFYEQDNNLFLIKQFYFLDNNEFILYPANDNIYISLVNINIINSIPRILFKITKIIHNELWFYIDFKYAEFIYKANIATISSNELAQRNIVYEFNILSEMFSKFKLTNISKNLYTISFEHLNKLLEIYNNIELLYKNNKNFSKVHIPTFNNIDVKESKDWISYDLNYNFLDNNLDLLEQLNLYKNGWTMLYDNQLFLLPPKLKETLEEIKKNDLELEIPWYKKELINNILKKFNYKLKEQYPYKNIVLSKNNPIEKILKPYQIIGVKWLKYLYLNKLNGCLADEMGLGKTLQVLTFLIEEDVKISTILIICPKILIKNWENEINKFNMNFNVITIFTSKQLKGLSTNLTNDKKNLIITSFGITRNTKIPLKDIDYLIIDEAQNIKNIMTASYQSLNTLNPKFKLLLTGTPLENTKEELLNLFQFLNPLLLKQISSNVDLKKLISPFLLRRTKKDVLLLPEKKLYDIFIEMSSEEKKLYTHLVKKFKMETTQKNRYQIKDNSLFLKMLVILRQLCCHPLLLNSNLNPNFITRSEKFERLKSIINNAKNKNKKIIVFSQFTKMLKIILKYIENENIKNYYLDGTIKNKNKLIETYEQDLDFSVFLISLKVGGVGITLTSAEEVVIYDPWWNPAVENQAIDRLHRIGQQKTVSVYYLYTKGTIEEKIYMLKKEKNELFLEILENQDNLSNISTLENYLL